MILFQHLIPYPPLIKPAWHLIKDWYTNLKSSCAFSMHQSKCATGLWLIPSSVSFRYGSHPRIDHVNSTLFCGLYLEALSHAVMSMTHEVILDASFIK